MASKQLKIGFVVDDTLDKPDGVQQYVIQLGKWLSAQGHEIHYLVGESARSDINNVHSLARNIPVRFNKNRLSIPYPASKGPVKQLLQKEKFDILHVQMPYHPFMAGKIVKLAPKTTAVVGTFHILPYSKMEQIATRMLGVFLSRNLKRFDAFFAVSEPAQTFAKRSFSIDAKVLPNVVDLSWFQKSANHKKNSKEMFTIIFLGRLVARKGALQLLQAVATLPTALKEKVQVVIGGKGELLHDLQEYSHEARIADRVTFAGYVAEEDKRAFLSRADIASFSCNRRRELWHCTA